MGLKHQAGPGSYGVPDTGRHSLRDSSATGPLPAARARNELQRGAGPSGRNDCSILKTGFALEGEKGRH